MKKFLLAAALAASLTVQTHAQSALSKLGVAATLDFESQYVFRGKKVANASFQPEADFRYPAFGATFYVNVWTNQALGRRGVSPGPDQADEVRFYTGGTRPLTFITPNLTLDFGHTWYWYPNVGGNANALSRSSELYAGLKEDTTSLIGFNLNPSVYVYHDFILDQNTVEASIKYVWDLSGKVGVKGVSLVPQATFGWNHANRVRGDQLNPGVPNWRDGYVYYGATLNLDYQINDHVMAFVGVRYAGNNDGTVFYPVFATSPQIGGSPDSVWAGVGLTITK